MEANTQSKHSNNGSIYSEHRNKHSKKDADSLNRTKQGVNSSTVPKASLVEKQKEDIASFSCTEGNLKCITANTQLQRTYLLLQVPINLQNSEMSNSGITIAVEATSKMHYQVNTISQED